ncbi:MAG: AAA family ATPase [Candidatus Scalindua sp.]|jgi:phage nucleotide-binding protein|nr:AAA family ATPase [Candidatus Scalindua sp.]
MAIKISNTNTGISTVKAMVYGEAGLGKTRLCATAPSPIIISAEAGLLSLKDYNIDVINVNSKKDVMDAYQFITSSADASKYHTICLDSVTEIAEVLLSEYKKEFKDPRQAYGTMHDDMTVLIRSFRDLPNFSVYFTAKQVTKEDAESGITMNRPDAPGNNLKKDLPFFFDEVLALRVGQHEGQEYRYLQTQPHMQWVGKDRSGKLDAQEAPDLTNIFTKILS